MESSAGINSHLSLIEKQAKFPRRGTVAALISQLEELRQTVNMALVEVRRHHCPGKARQEKIQKLW